MRTLMMAASAFAIVAAPAMAANTTIAAKPVPAMSAPAKPTTAAPKAKGTSKMATCAAQWKAMGDKGQATYKERAKTMKSKKGGKMSGYNAFTGECMKKA